MSIGIAGILIALGAALRIWHWATRAPLWADEAALAMNIGPKGFSEMGRPFVLYQLCPYGYLAISKISTLLFGTGEHALRLVPLLAGTAMLAAVALAARRIASRAAALVVLAFAAVSPQLVHYSAELKPYQMDATIAALLLLLAVRVLERPDARHLAALGVAGAVAGWISLPSIFVLGGVGAALLFEAHQRTQRLASIFPVLALSIGWLVSFAAHYFLFLTSVQGEGKMEQYWSEAFAPFPITSFAHVRWYAGHFFHFFESPGGFRPRYLAGLLWLAGCVLLLRRNKPVLILTVVPILLMTFASAMNRYPVHVRLLLFLLPSALITMSVPLAALLRDARRTMSAFAALLLIGLSIGPIRETAEVVAPPEKGPYLSELIAHLAAHWQPEDRLYLEQETHWIYAWYAWKNGFEAEPIYGQSRSRSPTLAMSKGVDWNLDLIDFEPLLGRPRIWIITPTFRWPDGSSRDEFITGYLDAKGERVEQLRGVDTNLYLYDLRSTRTSSASG
jgi:4-amino-4-deoxy-L-arabinose transferase-like glycosyltransferase